MIYAFLHDGKIKLGWSNSPYGRFKAMFPKSAGAVFLGCWEGMSQEEVRVHRKFAHLRVKGEWFQDAPEIRQHIAENAVDGAGRMEGFKKLLRAAGMSQKQLAKILNISQPTVSRWDVHGVPAERLAVVERVTGIPRAKLRPDLFGAE